MYSLETLKKMRDASRREAADAKRIRDQLQLEIDKITADAGDHETYRNDKIAAARERVAGVMLKLQQSTAARVLAKEQLASWTPEHQLSRSLKEPNIDVQRLMVEFTVMSERDVKLDAEEARAEAARSPAARARLYVAHQKSVERGFQEPITLDGVVLPEMLEAGAVVAQTAGFAAEVFIAAKEANGTPVWGAEKLTLGRAINAGRQAAGTIPAPPIRIAVA